MKVAISELFGYKKDNYIAYLIIFVFLSACLLLAVNMIEILSFLGVSFVNFGSWLASNIIILAMMDIAMGLSVWLLKSRIGFFYDLRQGFRGWWSCNYKAFFRWSIGIISVLLVSGLAIRWWDYLVSFLAGAWGVISWPFIQLWAIKFWALGLVAIVIIFSVSASVIGKIKQRKIKGAELEANKIEESNRLAEEERMLTLIKRGEASSFLLQSYHPVKLIYRPGHITRTLNLVKKAWEEENDPTVLAHITKFMEDWFAGFPQTINRGDLLTMMIDILEEGISKNILPRDQYSHLCFYLKLKNSR